MEKARPPKKVLAIPLLAVVLLLASLLAIYQAEASDWPLAYGGGLLVVGLVLMLAAGRLARRYAPKTAQA